MLTATVLNLNAPDELKAQVCKAMLRQLERELGGRSQAKQAYGDWLRIDAKPGLLEVFEVVQRIRWEDAFTKAVNRALDDCAADTAHAFFVVHLHQR